MSFSVESINSGSNGVQTQQAIKEQMLQMQELKEAKTQEDGTQVEDSSAVTAIEQKGDTVEISAEGQMALEQMKAAKSGAQPAVSSAQTAVAETSAQTSTEATEATEDTSSTESVVSELTDDDDDVSETDLYTMSETELRSLVADGTITRKEMADELERREGASDSTAGIV